MAHPYGNRSARIAAIVVILLRIPSKGRRQVRRGETRLTAQQSWQQVGVTGQHEAARWGVITGLAREYGESTTVPPARMPK
jgi:hypothetical protein